MNAVDTNIFLYSIDKTDPAKQLNARQLLQQLGSSPANTVLLWQVLGEMGQQLRRWCDQGMMTPAEFVQRVQAMRFTWLESQFCIPKTWVRREPSMVFN